MITGAINDDGTVATSGGTVNSTSSAKTTPNSSLDKDAFLQLLCTEMQYQDPLEPSSNTDYVAQLATFSQVEEMQNMEASMQQTQAADLIGEVVIMKTKNSSGETGYVAGTVDYWQNISDKIYLGVNGSLYDIEDVDTVMSDEYYKKYIESIKTSTDSNSTDSDSTNSKT